MEEAVSQVDYAARECTKSLVGCRNFCHASEHYFQGRALFHQRYVLQIAELATFIEADMQTAPDMYPDHPHFMARYGISRSRYYDYKKLRDTEALQAIAVRGELTSTFLREYNAAEPPTDTGVSAELREILETLKTSGAESDARALSINQQGLRLGMAPPVERPGQSINPAIKSLMKSAMAPFLGEITLTACKYDKNKAQLFYAMADTFKYSPMIIIFHGTTPENADKICKTGPDVTLAKVSMDDGVGQRVFFGTTTPPVADAWCRTEFDPASKVARKFGEGKAGGGNGAGLQETKDGQEQGQVTMRTMVAFKLLLVGRSAGIRPSGCTGNTWKFPVNALPLLLPICKIQYEWTRPGIESNKLLPTFPAEFPTKHALEAAPDRLLIKHMLENAIVARGHVTPEFLAYVFGETA